MIVFDTSPDAYRHWHLTFDGPVATLTLNVTADAGLRDDYQLKLNSYDLSVDIELCDATQRLRFEHPEIKAVVVTGGVEKTFCAGANIQMLASSSHNHKVNFCKFTNETRNAIEDATGHSGQAWIAAVNGTAAGGGYELALACDEIILIDDRASAVSLPEVPLLAVLPGTGGLTRLVDKRHVRRDLADAFVTRVGGVKGQQAVDWHLVDAVAPRSTFDSTVRQRAVARAAASDRPDAATGISLRPLEAVVDADSIRYDDVTVTLDREIGAANITLNAPRVDQPHSPGDLVDAGSAGWLIATARQLDDAMLRLRFNEPTVGTWVLRTTGDPVAVLAAEEVQRDYADDWLVREVRLLWTRTLKRLDLSARSLIAIVEPGSCFVGLLAELALAADQSFMLDTSDDPVIRLTEASDGWFPMSNGLTRLATRFWGRDDDLEFARRVFGKDLVAAEAAAAGLVTFIPDDLDWDDEVRLTLEARNSFSADALTGMEANLRFPGPETIETKIFARLTAWQNWIFQRPNAGGPQGALRSFGTGTRPSFDRSRT